MGLTSMEHFLGLPEALSEGSSIQNYLPEYDFDKEQLRVVQDARMWRAVTPGSPKWKHVIETMVEKDFTIVPTLVPWEPARDVARFANAEWHAEYTCLLYGVIISQIRSAIGPITGIGQQAVKLK